LIKRFLNTLHLIVSSMKCESTGSHFRSNVDTGSETG
jgi:hypothetical protein